MKQIITVMGPYLPIICVAIVGMLVFVVLLVIGKKNGTRKQQSDDTAMQVPLPTYGAYTLLTNKTLELDPVDKAAEFAVEYDITYVHSDEVI